ncbi:hypothetical protein LJ655_08940 [Paraburkholderia sp. MMS20-SJTN17]|uniref:Uncharacterized protein n=1 Tax=Paraburkholderia translucens TaxID=2886945 RepID=A0ABS8KBI3_9BURK|nr:hypothetical protein [Paraburkholderia sp. MMS20-SJTN17]MCC8402017.1 hypothetical protein [Paraburkholderia sp. MMS20-SJTN17]
MANDDAPLLTVSVYDGDFFGDLTTLAQICVLEGSIAPYSGALFSPLEESLRLLEMCAAERDTPRPRGDCFTVFIGRKGSSKSEVKPLVRLDVYAHNGLAVASVVSRKPRWDTERVSYAPDDDAVAIVCKILRANLSGAR